MKGKMKVFFHGILPVFILLCFFITHGEASIYMPNGVKDTYTYTGRLGGPLEAKVQYTCGPYWRYWTEFAGFGSLWVWTCTSNEYLYLYTNGRTQLFANFNAAVGSRWYIDAGECNGKIYATLAARNETVAVPAGTFQGCIRIDLKTSCTDGGVESIWFAPKAGVVKWISQSIAGPNPWEFKKGVVNGKTYPAPASITLTTRGGTDRFEYFINKMPVVDPDREPVMLHGQFAISNNTGRPIDFVFGPCEFDISIYDQEGNRVSHMNRGQDSCLMEIITEKTLEHGKTWSYQGEVELTDDEGNDLPEGEYTVECVLEARPRFSTSHTIKIRYTY
ncbi:MAG: BsuPI-related putative proteinase inhibitor [bacterium]